MLEAAMNDLEPQIVPGCLSVCLSVCHYLALLAAKYYKQEARDEHIYLYLY